MSVLLLVGMCFPFLFIPNAHTQSNATSTTMTIPQPSPGGCAMLPLAFTAHADDEIRGTFGSDTPINFYVLSQDDFNALQNCRLPADARPLFIEMNIASVNNPYRVLIHVDGTYYFVFTFIRSTSPVELASGYATVTLSCPPFVILTGPGASSTVSSLNVIITTTAPSTSTAISTFTSISISSATGTDSVQTTQTQPNADFMQPYMVLGGIGAAIVVIFIVVLVMKRRGRATLAPTTPTPLPPPQGTPPTTPPVTSTAQPKMPVTPAPRPSVTPAPSSSARSGRRSKASSQAGTRYTPEQVRGMLRDIVTRYNSGQIDRASFERLLTDHVFADAYGRWWTIDVRNGKWVQNKDGIWVEAEPPSWLEK